MDTKKVIVTLLILTIILSVLTVAFTLTGGKDSVDRKTSTDQATVGLYVADAEKLINSKDSSVGLYVSN